MSHLVSFVSRSFCWLDDFRDTSCKMHTERTVKRKADYTQVNHSLQPLLIKNLLGWCRLISRWRRNVRGTANPPPSTPPSHPLNSRSPVEPGQPVPFRFSPPHILDRHFTSKLSWHPTDRVKSIASWLTWYQTVPPRWHTSVPDPRKCVKRHGAVEIVGAGTEGSCSDDDGTSLAWRCRMQVTWDRLTTIWRHCRHAGQYSQRPSTCCSQWPLAASSDTAGGAIPLHAIHPVSNSIDSGIIGNNCSFAPVGARWYNMGVGLVNVLTRHLSPSGVCKNRRSLHWFCVKADWN